MKKILLSVVVLLITGGLIILEAWALHWAVDVGVLGTFLALGLGFFIGLAQVVLCLTIISELIK